MKSSIIAFVLNIIQKKGSPQSLAGRMLAYARILPGPEGVKDGIPWEDLVHNGLLVVSGDFGTQQNLGDFFRKEFHGDTDSGFEGLVQKFREFGADLPEGLTPDDLRGRMEQLSRMEIIPVPAKIVSFDSEDSLLRESGDIFFIGEYQGVQFAHLAVTSFPILYQAVFREQQSIFAMTEINALLDQAAKASEKSMPNFTGFGVLHLPGALADYSGNLLELLTRKVIPNLVYNLSNPADYSISIQNFKKFMESYRWPEDLAEMEAALLLIKTGDLLQNRHLDLLCRKISALHHEEFEKLPSIQQALAFFNQQK